MITTAPFSSISHLKSDGGFGVGRGAGFAFIFFSLLRLAALASTFYDERVYCCFNRLRGERLEVLRKKSKNQSFF